MTNPLISIIIPVYNVEKYLKRCLDSIFIDNNFDNFSHYFQVIAVNDGSTDRSLSILNQYAKRFPLLIMQQKNQGQSVARNFATNAATGKYIQYIDSDDYIFPNTLRKIISYLEDNPSVDLLLFDYANFIDGQTKFKRKKTGCRFANSNGQYVLETLLQKDIYAVFPWNKVVSRNLILKNDIFFMPGIINQDVEWTPRVFAFAKNVAYLDEIVYAYRHRAGATTDCPYKNAKKYSCHLKMLKSLTDFIETENFSAHFKETFYKAMTSSFWIVYINSMFNSEYDSVMSEFGYLKEYCPFNRRVLYPALIKLIGINKFYDWKYGDCDDKNNSSAQQ